MVTCAPLSPSNDSDEVSLLPQTTSYALVLTGPHPATVAFQTQPSPAVFEVFGHVAWFTDWMVEHTKTGDVLYVDHLVSNALEVQFVGDFEACTQAA